MALATVMWADGHRQVFHDEDKELAIEAYDAWRSGETADTVKYVILPPSWQSSEYKARKQAIDMFGDTGKLTNPGVQQGMSEIIPRGDR